MLTKTDIEYLDYRWNFYPGCANTKETCPIHDDCWARGMAHRFHRDFTPHLIPEKLLDPLHQHKPGRIGVNFGGDTFGEWVDPDEKVSCKGIEQGITFKDCVFGVIDKCPSDQFLFLTKRPDRLHLWEPFPDNCWIGASVCNPEMFINAGMELQKVKAKNKWLSFEPLLESINGGECDDVNRVDALKDIGLSWVVIGGLSRGKNPPGLIEWVKEIVEAADRAGIPVFLKNNLKHVLRNKDGWTSAWAIAARSSDGEEYLRQELPEVKG